jgi:monoamine oxidase
MTMVKSLKESLLFFLATLLLALPLNAQTPLAKDARIAVIGAGASGLTAAHTLRKKGYSNITVYEKDNRVGGKD